MIKNAGAKLTVVLPTRNRPRQCAAQLRLLHHTHFGHPIVVADSSDPSAAATVRDACVGVASYRGFSPTTSVTDKFLATLRGVDTPFVVTAPDDDVTLPHGIATALAFLEQNLDYVAAHGYVLRFGLDGDLFDIHDVAGFAPTVGQPAPMQRLYHLVRRYQPFIWAVFRTDVFVEAMEAASRADGFIFQELTFHTTAILRGKVARLPMIFAMRGMEESMSPLNRINPLFWFVDDGDDFFRKYVVYRDNLVRRILDGGFSDLASQAPGGTRDTPFWNIVRSIYLRPPLNWFTGTRAPGLPVERRLTQVVDLIHATWLGHECDTGVINHTVRLRLGEKLPELDVPPAWRGSRAVADADAVHPTASGRRYIWRHSVLTAEPREEIKIDADAMSQAERELDAYRQD